MICGSAVITYKNLTVTLDCLKYGIAVVNLMKYHLMAVLRI